MKTFNVWVKGPYGAWECMTPKPCSKVDAATAGAELSSKKAEIKVIVIPANIDPNEPGGQHG